MSGAIAWNWRTVLLVCIILIVVLMVIRCSDGGDGSGVYRTSGGSYGGYSSGGSHK